MKRFIIYFLIPGLLLTGTFSCDFLEDIERGNGNLLSKFNSVPDFDRIRVGGSFDVMLTRSEKSGIQVIADENLHQFIKFEVENKNLTIIQEKKMISKNKIRLVIEYTHIEEVRVTGAARIQNEGYIEEEELSLRMDGAGMIDIRIRTGSLYVLLSGAGVVKIAGETQRQELNLSGAGSLNAIDLESSYCEVKVSGLGGAEIFVTDTLDATIEGIGGIEYEGDPSELRTEVNGIGKIKPVDEY
jgi:hypothetical protein